MEQLVADDAVGSGEVDVLEDAQRVAFLLNALHRVEALFVDNDRLTGLDFAHEVRAEVVESAGLGGDNPAVAVELADTERAYAIGVSHRDQHVGREGDEAVGAGERLHRVRGALEPVRSGRGSQHLGGDFGVGTAGELVALVLEVVAEEFGVDDVAVMAHRKRTVGAVDADRLRVLLAAGAGG